MEESKLLFRCPLDNAARREPELVNGSHSIKCRICGMIYTALNDTDSRQGIISSVLRFGPNMLDDVVNETDIEGYAIFMVDDCGRTMAEPLAILPKQDWAISSCCQYDAYEFNFTTQLPSGMTGMTLAIMPNTTAGLLLVGVKTDFIEDVVPLTTERATVRPAGRVGRTAPRGPGGLSIFAAALTLMLMVPR